MEENSSNEELPIEVELEEEDEFSSTDDYVSEMEGTLLIFDLEEFKEKTNCIAVHITNGSGIWVLDSTSLEWRSFPVRPETKPKRKVESV